jgi:cation transport regulator
MPKQVVQLARAPGNAQVRGSCPATYETVDGFEGPSDMPYARNSDLPATVRDYLPEHAQDIFRSAFNAAYLTYRNRADREAIAHRVAWAAVKRKYRKDGVTWLERSD